MTEKKQYILDLLPEELKQWCEDLNEKPFRARQIIEWIYKNRAVSFEEMTNLSLGLREKLSRHFILCNITVDRMTEDKDGTKKFLLRLADGHCIETVFLPRKVDYTLCISSQVGCALGCRYCATGSMGIVRNLSAGEIVSQVLTIQKELKLSTYGNIVFMGMGEPLLNTEAILNSIAMLTRPDGLAWSPRRITLSTAGVLPEIRRLALNNPGVNLAISLNGADDKTRSRLMPINKKYPLNDLMAVLKEFPLASQQQKITYEYVMIRNINDTQEQARKLSKLLNPNRDKVNLIPYNTIEGNRLKGSDTNTIIQFQEILKNAGFSAFIRHSQGNDICAACGQLATSDQPYD